MPAKNPDLHGNAPDNAPVVLLLIDVINDLDFDDGEALLAQAVPMADRLAALKRRLRAARVPAIYVNDNFGRWRSDFRALLAHCQRDGARGRPLVERLLPLDDDYFVLKPKHSGFFSTTLDTLLRIPARPHPDPHRSHRRQLRAVHGQRRLSAGLPSGRAA